MKYKVRIVVERVLEVDENRTIKELKEIADGMHVGVAEDFGIYTEDIKSITIKKEKGDSDG